MSELTREQVEDIGVAIRDSNYPWKHQVTYMLETDAALRATITQQAQEVELVKERAEAAESWVGYTRKERDDLKQQLAAMTTERDEWKVKYTAAKRIQRSVEQGEFWYWNDDEQDHLDSLICPVVVQPEKIKEWKQQLAASQARCREVEAKLEIVGKDFTSNMRYQGQLERTNADLQATLAAREADIAKIKAELNETWVDERETVWTRPTAWAYAMVCKARDKHEQEAGRLRKALEYYAQTAIGARAVEALTARKGTA